MDGVMAELVQVVQLRPALSGFRIYEFEGLGRAHVLKVGCRGHMDGILAELVQVVQLRPACVLCEEVRHRSQRP